MSLAKLPIKSAIKDVLDANMDNANAADSREAFAQALADAVCDAIKDGIEGATITLVAPSGGGPVTGTITLEIV